MTIETYLLLLVIVLALLNMSNSALVIYRRYLRKKRTVISMKVYYEDGTSRDLTNDEISELGWKIKTE